MILVYSRSRRIVKRKYPHRTVLDWFLKAETGRTSQTYLGGPSSIGEKTSLLGTPPEDAEGGSSPSRCSILKRFVTVQS